MDNFITNLKNKLEELECDIRKCLENRLWITSKEGIDYTIRIEWKKNCKFYFLENDYFCKRARIGKYSFKSEHFDEYSVIDMYEYYILLNDLYYSEFKNGMNHFIGIDKSVQVENTLNNDKYSKFNNEKEIYMCIAHLLQKGYEFASKYPLPEIVEKQYNILKGKTIENITIDKIKEFMQENKYIHTYLDKKKITDDIKDLKGINEIEYSYGHIIAKSYTYKISMNLLPLEADIIVFDKDGINEVAICNVMSYKRIYKEKIFEELFKQIDNFSKNKENVLERENYDELWKK